MTIICPVLPVSDFLATSLSVSPPLGFGSKPSQKNNQNISKQTEPENSQSGWNQSVKPITSLRFHIKQWRSRCFLLPCSIFLSHHSTWNLKWATPPEIITEIRIKSSSSDLRDQNGTKTGLFYFQTDSRGWECIYITRLDSKSSPDKQRLFNTSTLSVKSNSALLH